MTLGLTRGELILVAIIFGLIYTAGLLPKIASRLSDGRGRGKDVSGRSDGD